MIVDPFVTTPDIAIRFIGVSRVYNQAIRNHYKNTKLNGNATGEAILGELNKWILAAWAGAEPVFTKHMTIPSKGYRDIVLKTTMLILLTHPQDIENCVLSYYYSGCKSYGKKYYGYRYFHHSVFKKLLQSETIKVGCWSLTDLCRNTGYTFLINTIKILGILVNEKKVPRIPYAHFTTNEIEIMHERVHSMIIHLRSLRDNCGDEDIASMVTKLIEQL